MPPNRLPEAVGGLLAQVSDAVVSAKDYFVESLRQGEDDSEDEPPCNAAFGPDGMPLRVAPGPRQVRASPPEVVLECVHATGVDVGQMPSERKSLMLSGEDGRWLIGRQTHPDAFVRLVPDEALRVCISRCHFELARVPGVAPGAALCLRKHSQNDLLVNGACVAQETVPVTQGALIGLCTPVDRTTPFLVFQVHLQEPPPPRAPSWVERQLQQQQEALQMQLPRTQNHSDQKQSQQGPQPLRWKDSAPDVAYRLVCTSAMGSEVATMPLESKTIGVHGHEPLLVGRQHQSGFFEALLGSEPRFLTIVGRSHVEIAPVPGDSGTFKVTNLSANPILMDRQRFDKGQHGLVRPPTSLSFIASKTADVGDAFAFLTVSFESVAAAANGRQLLPTSSAMMVGGGAGGVGGLAFDAPPAAAAQAALQAGGLPTSPLPPVCGAQPVQHEQQHHHQQLQHQQFQGNSGRPTLLAPSGPSAAQQPGQGQPVQAEASFCLELGGTAMRAGASASSRQIVGGAGGVTVGRLHQRQQLGEALSDDAAQYMSREHFRIERNAMCGGFNLAPLSSNLLWLSRAGQRVEARRSEQLPLAHGDVIQLYTGASDYTPDGPGCIGTVYWIFYDSASAPMHGRMVEETVAVQKQVGLPGTPRGPAQGPQVPATACYDMRQSVQPRTPETHAHHQNGWPESPEFGWQQQQCQQQQPQQPPASYAAAGYAPRGWEQQLPTPGTPVDPRSGWGGAVTPPRSPRSVSPRAMGHMMQQQQQVAQGWGAMPSPPASVDFSLAHQYGNTPAPMFGGGGGKGGGWGGGYGPYGGSSSNTYYEKAITD